MLGERGLGDGHGSRQLGDYELSEVGEAGAAEGGDGDHVLGHAPPVGVRGAVGGTASVGWEKVHLIEDDYGGLVSKVKLTEDFLDFFDVFRSVGVDDVDDMEEKVGVCKLFEGCAEGGYQDGGEFLDKADGVRQEDLAEGIDVPASGDGVKGGE